VAKAFKGWLIIGAVALVAFCALAITLSITPHQDVADTVDHARQEAVGKP
jgi:hypothetical protein